jgi:hypothetical protein
VEEKVGSQWATKWASSTNWANNYNFNQNPAGHDYNGFIYDGGNLFAIWANDYYGDDAGAVYFTRTSYTSVEEMVKVEDLKDYRVYTVDGKLVKGNLNELPRRVVKVVR